MERYTLKQKSAALLLAGIMCMASISGIQVSAAAVETGTAGAETRTRTETEAASESAAETKAAQEAVSEPVLSPEEGSEPGPAGKTGLVPGIDDETMNTLIAEAIETVSQMDLNEIIEYYKMVTAVTASEEFESLVQYVEVQELISEVLEMGAQLAMEEPETVGKILTAAGIDNKYVSLLTLALLFEEPIEELYRMIQSGGTEKEIRTFLDNILKTE